MIFCLFSITPCRFRTYFVVCFFIISSSVLEQTGSGGLELGGGGVGVVGVGGVGVEGGWGRGVEVGGRDVVLGSKLPYKSWNLVVSCAVFNYLAVGLKAPCSSWWCSLVLGLKVPCSSLCCFQLPCSWFKSTL